MRCKLLFITLFFSLSLFGQKSSEKYAERNSKCKYINKYSVQDRNSFYPFSKANYVLLISFDNPDVLVNELPITNQILDSTRVKEIKSLTTKEINVLSDILYNFCFTNNKFPKLIDEAMCYNPRNAILFLNEESKIYDYIEICFECNKIKFSSKEIKVGDNCTEKNNLIRIFFKSNDFKVGVSK